MSMYEYFNNLVEEKERLSNENADLKRALDKICNRQAYLSCCHGTVRSGTKCKDEKECAKCWKEWCLKK